MSPQGGGAMIGDNDVWDRDGWQIEPRHLSATCESADCDVCGFAVPANITLGSE